MPFKKVVTTEIEYEPTPEEMAEEFWHMDAEEQAKFFNRIGEIAGGRLSMQLEGVTRQGVLSFDGRWTMQQIGEYANVKI